VRVIGIDAPSLDRPFASTRDREKRARKTRLRRQCQSQSCAALEHPRGPAAFAAEINQMELEQKVKVILNRSLRCSSRKLAHYFG
jgi:hypothetical protein